MIVRFVWDVNGVDQVDPRVPEWTWIGPVGIVLQP
jgi:hypothetical protein